MSAATRLYMRHVRAARLAGAGVLCAPGISTWAARHSIDMRAFTREGMAMEDAEKIDDAFLRRAIDIAHAEAEAACDA